MNKKNAKGPMFMLTINDQGPTTTLGTIKGEAEAKEAAQIFAEEGYGVTVWRLEFYSPTRDKVEAKILEVTEYTEPFMKEPVNFV
jgi:hypothetical protein